MVTPRRSGTSIRGEHPPKGGNKQPKSAFFLAAFAALAHPESRAYYDRRRDDGKRHNAVDAPVPGTACSTRWMESWLRGGTRLRAGPPVPLHLGDRAAATTTRAGRVHQAPALAAVSAVVVEDPVAVGTHLQPLPGAVVDRSQHRSHQLARRTVVMEEDDDAVAQHHA